MKFHELRSPKLVLLAALRLIGLGAIGWLYPPFTHAQPALTPQPETQPAGLRNATRNRFTILAQPATRPDFPPIGVTIEKDGARYSGEDVQFGGSCDKTLDLTSQIRGVQHVAVHENGICYNSDIDVYTRNGKTYAILAGGYDAAWTHLDVTNPYSPTLLHQFRWDKVTYTPDIKAFQQGDRDYLALSMERYNSGGYCGVNIYDVTDPVNPAFQSQTDGADWCDVHNIFVETGADGDGDYIYLTANATKDMRVLDIGGNPGGNPDGSVTAPIEIGQYVVPNAGYIHDITVVDHSAWTEGQIQRRVYISYWDEGLVILDAANVTPGINPTPLIGPNVIDPVGFLVHHAQISRDGRTLFIQDEILRAADKEPVQMWDISNVGAPQFVDALKLGVDVPVGPAHNVEIREDLAPNRLFVGWYKHGLQAWDYTAAGFVRDMTIPQRTATVYHQIQTAPTDTMYEGLWAVRLAEIDGDTYILQADRRYGLIVDCMGPCNDQTVPTPTITATATEAATFTATATATPTASTMATVTPTPMPTDALTPTATMTGTVSITPLPTSTTAPSPTAMLTPMATPTMTPTSMTPTTVTPTAETRTPAASATAAPSATALSTATPMPTTTPVTSLTATPSVTPSVTPNSGTALLPPINVRQTVRVRVDTDNNGKLSPGDELHFSVEIRNGSAETIQNALFVQPLGDYLTLVPDSVNVSDPLIGVRTASFAEDRTAAEDWAVADLRSADLALAVGAIPADMRVVIAYRATLHTSIPATVTAIRLQGTLTGDNIGTVPTDNPETAKIEDETIIAIGAPLQLAQLYLPLITR